MAIVAPRAPLHSQIGNLLANRAAKYAIPVAEQILRGLIERKCFPQLLRRPLGRRMRGDIEMNHSPSIVSQNQKHVQDLTTNRRHGEEVDRHHGPDVILKEGPPGPRRRLSPTGHVFAHARFSDVDAQFEQFTMDTRRSR
jgi:hypothetical protein